MRWRKYPVLPEDDPLFEEFRVALDDDAARVLAYLCNRRESEAVDTPEATRLAVRVGTELGREATIAALSTLEEWNLVETTTVASEASGRPPKGWVPAADGEDLSRRVRHHHSRRLLGLAAEVGTHFGTPLPEDWPGPLAADDPPETDAVTVVLNWLPNALHAPLFVAAERGWYDRVGLSVDFEVARGSGAAVEALAGGEGDIAVTGAATLSRTDHPVVPVALSHQRSMAILYTTADRIGGPFTGVDQLRGRRLAVTPESEVGTLARLFLARTGLLEDVEIVTTAGEEQDAIVEGEADVATGMPTDARELAVAGHDVSTLAVADHFPVPGPVLAATVDGATERPTALARFLDGTLAGVALTWQDPGQAATIVADRSGDEVREERWRLDRAVERNRDSSAVRNQGWGWQSVADWQRLQDALRIEAER